MIVKWLESWVLRLKQFTCKHISTFSISMFDAEKGYHYVYIRCVTCRKLLHRAEGFDFMAWVAGEYEGAVIKILPIED